LSYFQQSIELMEQYKPQLLHQFERFSSVVQLSEWSVLNNSNSIKIPDFTAGAWRTNKPNMDINMENGGGTTRILG